MRGTLGTLGVLALVSVGAVSCNEAPGISNAELGFTIVDTLLLLSANDPSVGLVVLGSNPGNCPLLQTGAAPWQILDSDFLTFQLQAQDETGAYLPLVAGTYDIIIPPVPAGAGLFATSTEYETDGACDYAPTGANSGTISVQPLAVDAGQTSVVSYSVVFGTSRFSAAYDVTACVVPASATVPDAGTCLIPEGL